MSRFLRSLVIVGFAAVGLGVGLARVALAGSPVDDKLDALNVLSRANYAKAKSATLAHLSPIIVVESDALTLIRNGTQRREGYLPSRYRELKDIAHIGMAVYSLAQPHADNDDFGSWRDDLATYRAHVAELLPLIGDIGLHWDDAKRQRELLTTSLAFMDRIQAQRRVTMAEIRSYADDVGPILLGDLYDASNAELGSLDELVKRWRREMNDTEWQQLYVVVLGLGRPRERHPPYDYFLRLLGKDAEGSRLFHADNVTDVAGALDLLATTVNDRRLAAAFFNDPSRMDQGLMRESTKRHLDKMFGE